jgi:hypothetical protein
MLPPLLIAVAIVFTTLGICAFYVALGYPKHDCAICAKAVRERHGHEWSGPYGLALYTHFGPCTDLYTAQYLDDHYCGETQL